MENTKRFEKLSVYGGENAEQVRDSVPVNIIRQFPERPGEWNKKRIIVFVCTDSELNKTSD